MYISIILIIINHIGVATLRGRGSCSPLVKDRNTLIEQSVTQINEAHRMIVVYDEFMKQIRTVRHSFNNTGTANYRVRLAVPLQLIIIIFLKMLKKQVH